MRDRLADAWIVIGVTIIVLLAVGYSLAPVWI